MQSCSARIHLCCIKSRASREVHALNIKHLGLRPYVDVWQEMRAFTDARDPNTADTLWAVEHPPVYTLGQAGKREHLLNPGAIPIVETDRGGQVTYHGPGQLVVYTLIDLRRAKIGIRELVIKIENAVIDTLQEFGIEAQGRRDAPGVYVDEQKIAALGLRVRKGCAYHGLSLNVDMDLTPFLGINPCGYADLSVTSMRKLGVTARKDLVLAHLLHTLSSHLSSTDKLT